ncbi:DNA-processing protein DprA [Demequina activiva]|uniref:DNA processing protein DprA n=1 Tax=Demequina activiva TaxID=1582364 RepID=A0A919Q0X5_9MICO|nr:DNA-processing protein DprA [Demequina activiva]GIG53252.1 DNA processing protein DprA [Demequina activiva]
MIPVDEVGEMRPEGEARAWILWSAIAEPADAAAGALVSVLGASKALEWSALAARDPVSATARLLELATPRDVDEAIRASARWAPRLEGADSHALQRRARACGARIVTREDDEWPACVDDLGSCAPFALWVRGAGDLRSLDERSVAIVGARSATAYGEHVAAGIAGEWSGQGGTVVSGGAYGIDAAAHRATVAAGGTTLAIMAGGVDRLYPAGNADLLERVMREGLVVSEVPPGWAPHRSRFLTRNRLIATAGATVVVEAALRSGALSTVARAHELVRPVGAVPGPVTSASSAGCHALLRDGAAVLVTCGADVRELVGPLEVVEPQAMDGTPPTRLDFAAPADRAAFDAIGTRTVEVALIASTAGLEAGELRAALGRLEAARMVERDRGGWRRVKGVSLS